MKISTNLSSYKLELPFFLTVSGLRKGPEPDPKFLIFNFSIQIRFQSFRIQNNASKVTVQLYPIPGITDQRIDQKWSLKHREHCYWPMSGTGTVPVPTHIGTRKTHLRVMHLDVSLKSSAFRIGHVAVRTLERFSALQQYFIWLINSPEINQYGDKCLKKHQLMLSCFLSEREK